MEHAGLYYYYQTFAKALSAMGVDKLETADGKEHDWRADVGDGPAPAARWLSFLEEERRLREEDVLALQALPLAERVDRFRALGPLSFAGTALDDEGRFRYTFDTAPEAGLSKFREGDFLRLAPAGLADLQQGFPVVLAGYDPQAGRVQVRARQGRLALAGHQSYSLEEDLADWTGPRLAHAVRTVFDPDRPHPLAGLLAGGWTAAQPAAIQEEGAAWLRAYGPAAGLDAAQQEALLLPFRHRVALVEGPPGTGKTHLLAWTLVALVQQALAAGRPLRVVVTALTHQAIDGKVARDSKSSEDAAWQIRRAAGVGV